MNPLALLFGLSLFIAGTDLLAIQIIRAKQLGIAEPAFLGAIPIACAAGYALVVFFLKRIKTTKIRWAAFVGATLLAYMPIILAAIALEHQLVSIPLAAPLTKESHRKFEEAYHVKWGDTSKAIRVRRGDYSEAMAEFLRKLVATQGEVP
jgi:hypothetical protein